MGREKGGEGMGRGGNGEGREKGGEGMGSEIELEDQTRGSKHGRE